MKKTSSSSMVMVEGRCTMLAVVTLSVSLLAEIRSSLMALTLTSHCCKALTSLDSQLSSTKCSQWTLILNRLLLILMTPSMKTLKGCYVRCYNPMPQWGRMQRRSCLIWNSWLNRRVSVMSYVLEKNCNQQQWVSDSMLSTVMKNCYCKWRQYRCRLSKT